MFREPTAPPAFVATLGLAPQVITRALDYLLEQETDILQASIIHTQAYRKHDDWPTFETFQRYVEKRYHTIDWDWVPIQEDGALPLRDVNTPETAEIAFKVIYNTIKNLKLAGYRLHTLLAGGRKSIIVYSMISAQLLFDLHDKLWHLFSDDEHTGTQGWRPHVPLKHIELVEIPVLHLAGFMPMVRELILYNDDPVRAIHLYRDHDDIEHLIQLQRFFDECDVTDQRILWFRSRNYPNQEIVTIVGIGEPALINRLRRVAERFYRDPVRGSRYAKLPPKPHRAIVHALSPILRRMDEPPEL